MHIQDHPRRGVFCREKVVSVTGHSLQYLDPCLGQDLNRKDKIDTWMETKDIKSRFEAAHGQRYEFPSKGAKVWRWILLINVSFSTESLEGHMPHIPISPSSFLCRIQPSDWIVTILNSKTAETARCLLRWRHEHPGGSRWRTLRHQLLSRQVSVALDPRTWPIQKGSSGCWVWSQAKWFTDGLLSFERKPCAIWIYDLDVSLIPGSELVATFSFISSMRPSYQFDFMV